MEIEVRPVYSPKGVEQYLVKCQRYIDQPHEIPIIDGDTAWVEKCEDPVRDAEGNRVFYWYCWRHRKSVGCSSPATPPCVDLKAIVDGYAWRDSTGEQRTS